jgi:hypothetical protein
MRMPRHILKLIALLVAVTVTPAIAGNRSSCPYERARLAALAPSVPFAQSVAAPAARPKVPTRITLIDRVPADSLLGLGRNSGFVSP